MFTYVAVAAIGSLLLYCANIASSSGKRFLPYFLFAASVVFFCSIAAFRSLEVGTDVLVYGHSAFLLAKSNSLSYMFTVPLFSGWGPLYMVISWIAARVAGNMTGYLFVIQLLITLPTFIAIWRTNRRYAFIGVAIFGLFFFPISLNMMRQSAAMAFIVLMMAALIKRKWHESLIWLVIAVLLHQTALICAALYILILCMRKYSAATIVLLSLFLIVLYAAYPLVVDYFSTSSLYGTYLTGAYSEMGGGRRLNVELTVAFACLALMFSYFQRGRDADSVLSLLFCFTLMGVMGIWLSAYSYYLYRIGLYFLVASMLLVPYAVSLLDDRKSRMGFSFSVVIAFVVIHIDYFIVIGAHHVVPYLLAV